MKGLMMVVEFWECGRWGREWCVLLIRLGWQDGGCNEFGRDFSGTIVAERGCVVERLVVKVVKVGGGRESKDFSDFAVGKGKTEG